MTSEIVSALVLAIAISSATITVTMTEIFRPLRSKLAGMKNPWLGKLITCHYCLTHHLAFWAVLIYRPYLVHGWAVTDFLATWFAVVAVATLLAGQVKSVLVPKAVPKVNA